ncbi:MAG TPA: hypothetical protein VK184_13230 [Nostocaceae cyanobacterium]|nr:hypothetical protein [Nostocaceae cyanobacterium]
MLYSTLNNYQQIIIVAVTSPIQLNKPDTTAPHLAKSPPNVQPRYNISIVKI